MDFLLGTAIIILLITMAAAWFTHVCVCLRHNRWGILLAGIIALPVAVIHGVGTWFGKFPNPPKRRKDQPQVTHSE